MGAGEAARRFGESVRRAFVEFLFIPTLVIAAFMALAAAMYALDAARVQGAPAASGLWGGMFSEPQATRTFLGVIAGSIITVTSITLSLLLIAVQQGAASLTSMVFDQFLRRRANQFYFGFFIGLALYALTVLTSVTPLHQPVYAAGVAGLMTLVALYMLIVLIYTTIDQMRPVVILKSIHDHTLRARAHQRALLAATRRPSQSSGVESLQCSIVTATRSGFMTRIDTTALAKALAARGAAQVAIIPSIGDFILFGDDIAEVRGADGPQLDAIAHAVRGALVTEEQRDLDTDPAFGVEQLVTIGWTSISTAKSNPAPGLLAIWHLGDLLARWLGADEGFGGESVENPSASISYRDVLSHRVMSGFESLLVVASESMQHQSAAEAYRTLAKIAPRLPPALRLRAVALTLTSLSAVGDHVLTHDLDGSLDALAVALAEDANVVARIEHARRRLAATRGDLHSRSTRAGSGNRE